MKSAEEIAARAIILLSLSDRCAVESAFNGGRRYTLKQREEQRQAIYRWLQDKGYISLMTANEKVLFEQEVGKGNKNQLNLKQIEHESIEPCLWSLGLIDKLSTFDNFVIDDFHPVLEIGINHSLENLLNKCSLREYGDIVLQNEITMLWHWRARESNNSIFSLKPAKAIIISTFGEQYFQVLDSMPFLNDQDDFMVNNKTFHDLNAVEKDRLRIIAQWRHHAFEWIIGDKSWDEVELNT